MKTKEPQASDVTENRFRTVFMFLRMAGITINKKKRSVYTSVYYALVTLHGYALYPAFLMDSIVHKDDLKLCMQTFRAVVVASLILWLYLNLRYINNKAFFWYMCYITLSHSIAARKQNIRT